MNQDSPMSVGCGIKKCKESSSVGYAAFGPGRTKEVGICERHWQRHCSEKDKFDIREYFYPTRVAKKKK